VPYDDIRAREGEEWASITVAVAHGLRPEKPGFGVPSEEQTEKIIVETENDAGRRFVIKYRGEINE